MNGFGSFLSNDAPLPFDLNEFYRESPPLVDQNSIQVIHSQDQQQTSSAPLNDFYNSLIPSKLEAYNPEMNYASSYQPPPLPSGPPMNNYPSNTPSYIIAPPPPPASYQEYSPGIPLPPLDTSSEDYSWNWNTSIETPHSPPHFERKGRESGMIEYIDDSLRPINESSDVDHRQLMSSDNDGSVKGLMFEDTYRLVFLMNCVILFRC